MSKVGRNDPCPCGSGKKYKKCCEVKGQHKPLQATRLSSVSPISGSAVAKISNRFFQKSSTPPPCPSSEESSDSTS